MTLIEALCNEWPSVWPPLASVRQDILAWLFGQLQPLLRSQNMTLTTLPVLKCLDRELERLATQLNRQKQLPLVTLQALHHQVKGLMQRLERNAASGDRLPLSTRVPEPAFVRPVVILPARPLPNVLPAASKTNKRRIVLWLLALAAATALAGGWWEWNRMAGQNVPTQQAVRAPVRLNSLSLFEAGSTELKPGSIKGLINALVNIQAQPGWLIVIVGHTDNTGNAEQNLQLSYARASAVRSWMQRMGDIPDTCFAVQGVAGRQPIASNDTASGRAANRRVDIRLVPQDEGCALSSRFK